MSKIDRLNDREFDEIVSIASDMAWGEIKAWRQRGGEGPDISAADVRVACEWIANDWHGCDVQSPARDVARQCVAKSGYPMLAGSIL